MEIDFTGKRALITGAGQGIGRGIAQRLIKCGAVVIAVDISLENLKELKNIYPQIETLQLNITDWELTQETIAKVFPIDLLVNSAGIGEATPLMEVTEQNYDKSFGVNVKGLIAVTKAVIFNLLERKSPGAIVNISSQASQAALLNHTVYGATKGAVDAFTRTAALEFGPHNIRINAVNPTVVLTELGKKIWDNDEMGKPMLAKIPLNRFAEVDDVVDAVVYLLSDKAKMITGSCLAVDGGFLAC